MQQSLGGWFFDASARPTTQHQPLCQRVQPHVLNYGDA
jgi:hypothetical protein